MESEAVFMALRWESSKATVCSCMRLRKAAAAGDMVAVGSGVASSGACVGALSVRLLPEGHGDGEGDRGRGAGPWLSAAGNLRMSRLAPSRPVPTTTVLQAYQHSNSQ